jgi:hypothetical protein
VGQDAKPDEENREHHRDIPIDATGATGAIAATSATPPPRQAPDGRCRGGSAGPAPRIRHGRGSGAVEQ